ncbi:hypothetical protein [Lentzea californiensis]|nr:hypothetical protein [Lentzea californiensis]MCR3751666.1 hypothetical protein [Lentzea californiensis]
MSRTTLAAAAALCTTTLNDRTSACVEWNSGATTYLVRTGTRC